MANDQGWIDDKPIGSGGFGASADTTQLNAPPPQQPQGWGDLVSDAYKLGKGSLEEQYGNAERFMAPTITSLTGGDTKAWQQSGDDWVKSGQAESQSLTPAGQQTTDAPFFSMETLQHPINKTVMGIPKQGAWSLPALIPGGGWVPSAARAIVGGALGYTGAYGGVLDTIKAQSDDQLQKNSPTYMELRKTLPEWDAKQALGDQAWSNIPTWEKAAILGTSALAGEAGPLSTVGKTITSGGGKTLASLASGRIGQIAIGAAETGGVQAGQYLGTAIPTRDALTSVGAPADTNEQIARNTAEQFGMGAVIGGSARALKRVGGQNESGKDPGADQQKGGAQIGIVPEGQAGPAEAAALKSATQPTGFEDTYHGPATGYEQEYPPNTGFEQQHPGSAPIPPRPPTGFERPYTEPGGTPPTGPGPRPPFTVPPPGTQRPLGLNVPEQPHPGARGPQFELPLRQPETEPQQGTLDLQQPSQGVTQPGFPGMGADVIHVAPEKTTISPDQDSPKAEFETQYDQQGRLRSLLKKKEDQPSLADIDDRMRAQGVDMSGPLRTGDIPPEKSAPKRGPKSPLTKDSDKEPTTTPAAKAGKVDLPKSPDTAAWLEGDDTAARAATMADREKAAGQKAANDAVARGKPNIPRAEQPTATKGKAQGTFDTSKLGLKAEAPAKGPKAAAAVETSKAKGKAQGTFDTSKLGAKAEGTTEGEQPKLTRTQAKQAAIAARLTKLTADKFRNLLVHGKIKKASVDDIMAAGEARKQPIYQHPTTGEYYVNTPTAEVKGEPKVTVVPPTSAHLKPITPGAEAVKKAAAAVAALEKEKADKAKADAAAKEVPKVGKKTRTIKGLENLGEAIAEKEAEPTKEKSAGGTSNILNDIVKAFDQDKDEGEGESDLDKHFKDEKIEEEKGKVNQNPTEPQEAAGNFKQGHLTAQGQPVTIHSAEGEHGQAEGHILGTADNIPGEHLDTLIHSSDDTGVFHVVNEIDKNTSRFVRHVVVQGAANVKEALKTFAAAYKRKYGEFGDKLIAEGIVPMSREEFERWKQTRNPNEAAYPSDAGKHPLGYVDTSAGRFKTQGSSTLKTALQEALRRVPNTSKYMIYRKLAEQVIKYLPDVPVYYLRKEDFNKVDPNAHAIYNYTRNHILIGDDGPHPELTLIHEALHAATAHLYSNNKVFRALVDRLTQEYKQGMPGINDVMSHNVKSGSGAEMLAELGLPRIQGQLAKIRMSHELARDLGMDTWAKETQTLWGGFVKSFMDALHTINIHLLGADDTSRYTLLDGLLKLNDEGFMARSQHARTDFANMRRAMEGHNESVLADREKQHNSQENIYNTIHDAVSNPEKLQDHYYSYAKSMSDRATDLIDKLPSGILMKKSYDWIVPFKGSDTLRMDTERLWGEKTEANPERRWGETNLRRDGYLTSLITKVNNTIHDMYSEYRRHTKAETDHLTDTAAQSTAYRIDPRYKIGEGTNAWLTKPGWQWKNEAQLALAHYDRIVKMYNDIHPGLKPRFSKLANEYHAAGLERAKLATNELIDSITNAGQKFLTPLTVTDPHELKVKNRQEYIKFHNDWETNWDKNKEKLRDQLLKGNLGENEERWLKERGFDDVSDIDKLANPRGLYIPLDHAGQFGINGEYKIEKPTNGTQVAGKDNAFDFKTEAAAEAFYNKQPPNSRMAPVYFNDEGKEASRWDTWQKPDGSVGFAKDNKAYRVEVNNKYYSGHDSISAGNKRYRQLKASGAFSKLSLPQSKRSGWYQGIPISSPLFNHLMAKVDERTDYTEAQKTAVKNLLRDTALSSLEGNRISKHMIERKTVAGWDTDYIKTYKSYMDGHNALISRVKYSKDMNSAINDMIKYAEDHEGEEGATERGYVLDEINKRDNFFGTANDQSGGEGGGLAGRVMKYAEAVSFFAHMVSPGHLITHQTHQILTYDVLAAKYGPLKAAAMAGRMHSIMAGTGFRNVMRSIPEMVRIITKDSKGLNYVEGLMDKMGQHPKYGADLTRMLNEAIATNRLHPDQGFDASVLHMGSGRLDRGLARLDLASRQMMGSTEAYSRVWGYSLGYALARDAGETHEQAMRTAFDTVSRTQGILSRSNMSSRMNKWYMRAPMQFRAWGINMMMTHANSIYNIFKPDAPGVRAEAVRRLLYMFGSTAALTGINGLPSDPMRVGLALAGALGLTNYNWSDAQNKMREYFAEKTSPGMANFLMDGAVASLGPFSFFGGDRIGFGSLAVFGEPDSYSKGDISEWLLGIMGGAPFGEVSPMEIGDGIKALQEGNYAKATQVFVPLKLIDDWAKAWQGMYEGFPTKTGAPGMTPYSAGETFMQSLGLTPARKERWREASSAEYRAEQANRTEHSELLNALGTATTEPDRMKARMQISAYNLRNPDARITPQDVARALRRQTAPSGLGRTLTKGNQQRIRSLEEYYEAY